jgi:GDPmannose 4,6-dehydratase/GDP-4-dehydro-6-deoxy-D-mannose reductase
MNRENVLVTGITGSGGSYIAEYILAHHPEYQVVGICRWHSTSSYANIDNIKDKIILRECDLMDLSSIIRVLKDCQPKRIFNLAAYANVRKCFDTPLSVINNNIMGTANLLEAIRIASPDSLLQMCSTSEVYGNPKVFPMTEEHPLCPVNPYSVSKLAQERLAYAYFKSWGIRVIITRMFTYLNPRRGDVFATAFARQVVRIENGLQKVLKHGNLDSLRTIIDVRDAMRAYWLACDRCELGEAYNIGGGTVKTVGQFLDVLKSLAKVPIESEVDPALLRPIDVTCQIPDTSKFDTATGFKPQYSFEESVQFLLDHCRKEKER